jgi:hypothetical protein
MRHANSSTLEKTPAILGTVLHIQHTTAERCLTYFLQGMCKGNETADPHFEDICRYQTKRQKQGIFFAATL